MDSRQAAKEIMVLIQKQESVRKASINLVSSENLTSPQVTSAVCSDFMHRYMLSGKEQFEAILKIAEQICKTIFSLAFVEFRAISGQLADMIIFNALSKPGHNVMLLDSDTQGAHPLEDACRALGRRPVYFEFNPQEYNIDVDKTVTRIEKEKPDLILFNAANLLFPHPVKIISESTDASICYDASHPLGLITGGQFPHPIEEGADVMIGGTQKTLPGTQHALIMSDDPEVMKRIVDESWGPKNAFAGNRHYNDIVGLALALCETAEYGKQYAEQIVKNAKALASDLNDVGFNPLCPDKGFTETQTILVNVGNLGGGTVARDLLDQSNITSSATRLPVDKHEESISGIRLGTPEVTRLGMREAEMGEIAQFIKKVLLEKKSPKRMREEIAEFRSEFQDVHYRFTSLD